MDFSECRFSCWHAFCKGKNRANFGVSIDDIFQSRQHVFHSLALSVDSSVDMWITLWISPAPVDMWISLYKFVDNFLPRLTSRLVIYRQWQHSIFGAALQAPPQQAAAQTRSAEKFSDFSSTLVMQSCGSREFSGQKKSPRRGYFAIDVNSFRNGNLHRR